MNNESEIYKKVAKKCHAYEPVAESEFTNSSRDCGVSCKTCTHFTDEEHCVLDLYDKIVETL